MFKYVVLLCALYACFAAFTPVQPANAETVWEILSNDTNKLTSFLNVVIATNNTEIIDALKNATSSVTVFAPTDDAITKNATADLAFVQYSIAMEKVPGLANGQIVYTLLPLGTSFQVLKATIDDGKTLVNGESKVTSTWNATNGYVHALDKNVTFPPTFASLVETDSLSTLKALLNATGTSLTTPGQTVFAPVNDAFDKLPKWVTTYLQTAEGVKNQLPKILLNHVVNPPTAVFYAYGKNGTFKVTSAEGSTLDVTVTPTTATVNNATIKTADVLASTGVAHVIDGVLVPADIKFSVVDVLTGLEQTEFIKALNTTTDLYPALSSYTGSYTVFSAQRFSDNSSAPASYHVVSGTFLAADLKDGLLLTSSYKLASNRLQELKVTTKDGKVYINGVEVTSADNTASNGVVHVLKNQIPTVPAPIPDQLTGDFSTLGKAAGLAKLDLLATGNYTIFAPTNAAFEAVNPAIAGYLFMNTTESNTQLQTVLLYHALGSTVYSVNLKAQAYETLLKESINVADRNGTFYINDVAKITAVDALASNGVIHTIDNVLVPQTGLNINAIDLIKGLKANQLVAYLNKTGLLPALAGLTNFTAFVPSDAAFNNLKDKNSLSKLSNTDLAKILEQHVVNGTIPTLKNGTYKSLAGSNIRVYSSGKNWYVNIEGAKTNPGKISAGTPTLGSTQKAVVYPIDQVLGQKDAEKDDDDDGLTSTEVGLIVAGCIVAVLLAGAAIGGGVWYYKRRHGYEQIDNDSTF
eukprot:TRINITY_DN8112_c0_g1_i2.p1 TRINITY_DN8112_c0_g1~~TRINITY_DN8112_c0_g1_i2.p1  ORF type:complete len:751 (+),score=159.33 TRINITY_DN8112_c0_g1_i2:278-2530(+)